jgi:hypothetical protein
MVISARLIDDGYRSKFISNGRLEQLYLDSIGNLLSHDVGLPVPSAWSPILQQHR